MKRRNANLFFAFAIAGAVTFAVGMGCSNTGVGVPDVPPAGAASPPSLTPAASPSPGTFSDISLNILQPRCISCHSTAAPSDGVNLSTYAGVLAQVVPSNAAQSPLYTQVESGAMPPSGSPLSADQIQDIYNWIENGANND